MASFDFKKSYPYDYVVWFFADYKKQTLIFDRSPAWYVPIIHNYDCHVFIDSNGWHIKGNDLYYENALGLNIKTPMYRDWINNKDFMNDRQKRNRRKELKKEGVILREWAEQFEKRLEENLWLWDPNDPKIKIK